MSEMLNIALPKGRLGEKTYGLLRAAGFDCPAIENPGRRLIFENEEKGVVFWDEQFCGWRRTSNGAFHNGVVKDYRMSNTCDYEVIGNIHDNPELLGD